MMVMSKIIEHILDIFVIYLLNVVVKNKEDSQK